MTQQERNGLNEAIEISVHAAGAVRGASYIEIATIGDIKRRNEERRAQLK